MTTLPEKCDEYRLISNMKVNQRSHFDRTIILEVLSWT
jgi:hypothetical protein